MQGRNNRPKFDKLTFRITPQGEKIMKMLEDGTFSWEKIAEMVDNGELE